jgi:hypothetical protein
VVEIVLSGVPTLFDFFVSHAFEDAVRANHLAEAIESAGGSCWIAPRDIPPGADYGSAILDGIASCRSMVILVSAASISSSHVRREAERAVDRDMLLFPVRLQPTPVTGSLEYFLSGAQHLDWFKGDAGVPAVALVSASDRLSGAEAAAMSPATPKRPGASAARRWVPAFATFGLVAIVAILAMRSVFPSSKERTAATGGSAATRSSGIQVPPARGPAETLPGTVPSLGESGSRSADGPASAPSSALAEGWRVALNERWDDNRRGWAELSKNDENGDQEFSVEGGNYIISIGPNKNSGSYQSNISLKTVHSYSIELNVRTTTVNRTCAIVVQHSDGSTLFAGASTGSRRSGVVQFKDGVATYLVNSRPKARITAGATARLGLVSQGKTSHFFVNGMLVADFVAGDTPVIGVGVGAQYGENFSCVFDNLEVRVA